MTKKTIAQFCQRCFFCFLENLPFRANQIQDIIRLVLRFIANCIIYNSIQLQYNLFPYRGRRLFIHLRKSKCVSSIFALPKFSNLDFIYDAMKPGLQAEFFTKQFRANHK